MLKHIPTLSACFLAQIFLTLNPALAITYYENNYDTGSIPKFSPDKEANQLWTLPKKFSDVYGEGNFFNLSDTLPHSGRFCLRFTYEALNEFCNTCGHKSDNQAVVGDYGVDYFISSTGKNLSLTDDPTTRNTDDGINAEPGKIVYNKDGGYSRWEILSTADQNTIKDRLNLKLRSAGIHGENTIRTGDEIAITRQCGIDGIVGISKGKYQINRRSDCNGVIMWFDNVSAQQPGDSIYRRQYLKADVSSSSLRQKLHYLRPDRKGPHSGEIVLFGQTSSTGEIEPELHGLKQYGSALRNYKTHTATEFAGLEFKRNTWYYVEEQYKFSTVKALNSDETVAEYSDDGEYRLWFAESGSEPGDKNNPTLELTKLQLPPIRGGDGSHISFWGNTQHKTDSHGSWYIDDVKITNTWNGPVYKLPSIPSKKSLDLN